ncbi:MAG TPA: CHAD domain-containing protein, partial [Thermoplasmata archaeon]|nr:CHAD domain-containing protein [Thermoplasmata archaeon]
RILREDPRRTRRIRKLVRALGEVRDADIMAQELRAWVQGERARGSGRGYRNASSKLEQETTARRARLARILRADPGAVRRRPAGRLPIAVRAGTLRKARDALLRRLSRAHRRAVGRPSPRRLHQVRKRIRELGLLREWSEAQDSVGQPRHGAMLHRLMRRLGRINDRATLIRWLRGPGKGPGTEVILRSLRAQDRHDRADLHRLLRRTRSSDWKRWVREGVIGG